MSSSQKLYSEILSGIHSNESNLKNEYIKLFEENKLMKDSFVYASVLQKGILAKQRHFERVFSDSFILYKPLHYISGDFYWLSKNENFIYFAAADSTGHGVPGAMLSMLGHGLLNYAILDKGLKKSNQILKEMDKRLIESFSFENNNLVVNNDWIDIALCVYDEKSQILSFSGARRDLLLIRNNKLFHYKGVRYPIGGWQLESNRSFKVHKIKIVKGDKVYLGSDGYQDQFGGEQNRKFGSKNLHNLLFSIHHKTMSEQKQILDETLNLWKQNHEQTDDICLMGVQL
ncbi:MAG TPA: hypothetical protein DDX39_10485 [Bacteroidales bacterium]|nr:MAG: hypothetical protein A2W98_04010 [Bacteroidetes bacterium GWF2_33_38]OFY92412.1 MAG: hypothetical protein A2236_05775 [Bacteroidetes bacterium RIFOXYA2_FULL_33_7]HBF89057.1 hypothetical protein [Bacteroidales bacterium]